MGSNRVQVVGQSAAAAQLRQEQGVPLSCRSTVHHLFEQSIEWNALVAVSVIACCAVEGG